MFTQYRTQGLILKKIDRGEADQLFTLYTKDFGKLEVLGRAIRKTRSKLRSGAELFYLSEVEFIQGKTYKTLTNVILIEKFKNLRKNLKRLAIAYKISEAFNNLVGNQDPDKKIWQLLNEIFNKLNNWKTPDRKTGEARPWRPFRQRVHSQAKSGGEIIYYYFLWNLLSVLGYQPELYDCSLCQKKIIPGKIYFSPKEGGVICPACFKKDQQKALSKAEHYQEIDSDIIKILRIILKKDWNVLSRLKISHFLQKKLNVISKDFLSVIPLLENF